MKTIVHVNNVCLLGGTMLNTLTYAKAYPEFRHVVLYLQDIEAHQEMLDLLDEAGVEVVHARRLNEAIVARFSPFMVLLKNTPIKLIDGGSDWLLQWPLVYSHHSRVWGPFKCDWRIFNSKYLMRTYPAKMFDGLQSETRVIGSLVDTAPFSAIKRPVDRNHCVVGRVSSRGGAKFPPEALSILTRIHDYTEWQALSTGFFVVGAEEHWKDRPDWLDAPPAGSRPVADFYRDMDIMVYRTDDTYAETWGRVITEAMAAGVAVVAEKKGAIPEQIDDGVNGYLCSSDDEFVERTINLIRYPAVRQQLGEAARKKATTQFDVAALRRMTSDIILGSLVREGSRG